jgi:hypothetical protein
MKKNQKQNRQQKKEKKNRGLSSFSELQTCI